MCRLTVVERLLKYYTPSLQDTNIVLRGFEQQQDRIKNVANTLKPNQKPVTQQRDNVAHIHVADAIRLDMQSFRFKVRNAKQMLTRSIPLV